LPANTQTRTVHTRRRARDRRQGTTRSAALRQTSQLVLCIPAARAAVPGTRPQTNTGRSPAAAAPGRPLVGPGWPRSPRLTLGLTGPLNTRALGATHPTGTAYRHTKACKHVERGDPRKRLPLTHTHRARGDGTRITNPRVPSTADTPPHKPRRQPTKPTTPGRSHRNQRAAPHTAANTTHACMKISNRPRLGVRTHH